MSKYDSWLIFDETEADLDIEECETEEEQIIANEKAVAAYNDFLISRLMCDIYFENYEDLNGLCSSMLDDTCNKHSSKYQQIYGLRHDFDKVKTGEMLTYKNRTIAQACIDDKQGNVPISFVSYGNINIDLILNILANFSYKIYDENDGENINYVQNYIVNYNEISTILDYYKQLFDKLEEYYLNIGSQKELYRLYENFYLMTEGALLIPNSLNNNTLQNFKKYILKELKFLNSCLKHIDQNYEKDEKGLILLPKY